MNTRTPADWKALFESDAFVQQNTYTGPLGVEYTPAGTRLRLWAPTALSLIHISEPTRRS